MSADACPRVSDLPDLLREDAELAAAGRKSALRVFVQYWNNTTDESRAAMLDADLDALFSSITVFNIGRANCPFNL